MHPKIIAGYDRSGPLIRRDLANKLVADDINLGNYLQRTVKEMTTDFEKASQTLNEATDLFNASLSNMLAKQREISEVSKRVSGDVRKAANDLAQGLAKVDKTANFDRLERNVATLERAAAALEVLATLESTGKLDKIMKAIQ